MDQEDILFIKRQMQQVSQDIESLEADVETLHNNGVATDTSQTLSDEQQALQDELEQLATDILIVLDESDTAGNGRPLPNSARRPVERANLPTPRVGSGNAVPWSNAGGNSN